jgi:hypothetical protein
MSNRENHEEWDLDYIDPSDNCPDKVGEDSLGDTDYPESHSDGDGEGEGDDERKKTYRERHLGYLYYRRNPHRHYESFSGGKEKFSDSEDEDEDEECSKSNGIDSKDVYIGDDQSVSGDNVADSKTLDLLKDTEKADEEVGID